MPYRSLPPPAGTDVPDVPLGRVLWLHFAPGLAAALFFAATAPRLAAAGLPAVWGLLLAVLVVVVPVEAWLIRRASQGARAGGAESALAFRRPLPPLRLVGYAALTFAAAAVLPGLGLALEPVLRERVFGWLPAWYAADPGDLALYSPGVRWATVALWVAGPVLLGPVVEEAYFRGYLLPKLSRFGRAAPAIHAALFAGYHLWQPHAVVTVFLTALPLAYAAWWTRSWVVSAVAHCAVNAVAFAALASGAFAR